MDYACALGLNTGQAYLLDFQARRLIESEAAALAALNASDQELARTRTPVTGCFTSALRKRQIIRPMR